MHFTFAANTSLKEKAWEKHKYFRIPVGVPHSCSELPTVWMQRKKKKETVMDKPAAFIQFPFWSSYYLSSYNFRFFLSYKVQLFLYFSLILNNHQLNYTLC